VRRPLLIIVAAAVVVGLGTGAYVYSTTLRNGATKYRLAKAERGSLVASGAVVRESAEFPEGSVIAGVPAKAVRKVDEALATRISLSWKIYRELARTTLPAKPAISADPSRQVVLEMSERFTRLLRGD